MPAISSDNLLRLHSKFGGQPFIGHDLLMSGFEILKWLVSAAGVPGAVAAVILALAECYRAWSMTRRVRIRLGNSEIEAPSLAEALSVLSECERLAEARRQARPIIDRGSQTERTGEDS